MDPDLVARIKEFKITKDDSLWKRLEAFRGRDIMDYDHKLKDAKDSNRAILYYSADNLVLIKEIQSYHTIRDLCTAVKQTGIYALHILIMGTGYKYPFNPKTESEKEEHAQPLGKRDVRHPLIVTLNEHPPLIVEDKKYLEEIYRAFVS